LQRFLLWIIDHGQAFNPKLFYAVLPEQAKDKARKMIRSMTFNDEKL
jgi:hypothetical protein